MTILHRLRRAERRRHGSSEIAGAAGGILLDPVYTGKAMAGLIDGIVRNVSKMKGRFCLFIPAVRRAVRLSSPRLAPGTLMQESINWLLIPCRSC